MDWIIYVKYLICSIKHVLHPIFSNSVFQSVIGGTFVFIVGELIQRLYVTPIVRYNELRSEVCFCLVHYANTYMNPCNENGNLSDWYMEAERELRRISSRLEAFAQENKYGAKRKIPSKRNLQDAASRLRRLSNSLTCSDDDLTREENRKDQNAIRLYMNLDVEDYTELDTIVTDEHYRKIIRKKTKNKG